MKTTWKSSIHKHPIFQYSPAGHDQVPNSNILAIHGSEFFVACGNIVRYSNIAASEDYVELDIPSLDFTITSLLLNNSRSLLVINGRSKVIAVFVPRGPSLTQRTLRTQCVGETDHAHSIIRQVSIHPNCSSDNSIVVLTADSYLRLYDFNLSFQEAESTVDLLSMQKRKSLAGHYIGDTAETEASAFCFGSGGDGWTVFTTFVLMQNGDIYAICPFLPCNCHLTTKEIDSFEAHAAAEPGTQNAATLIKLRQAIDNGTRSTLGVSFVRPIRLPPSSVSGPVLFCPAPLEFTKVETIANSICFVPSQPLNVLAVASEGKVDVCTVTDSMLKSKLENLEISVHESIALPATHDLQLRNFSSDSSFYVSHNNGLHEVEMKFWLQDMQAAFESGSSDRLQDSACEGISSSVTVVLDSEKSPVIGWDMLEDDFEKSLVLIRTPFDVHLVSLGPEPIMQEDDSREEEPVIDTSEDTPVPVRFQSLLSGPFYKPRQLPRSPQVVVPSSLAHKNIKANVESVKFLARHATQTQKDIETLMDSFIAMHRRLALQQKEHKRQMEKVKSLELSVEKLENRDIDRLAAVEQMQKTLERRCTKLLQDLMNDHSPKLSDSEKRYFEELKRIEKHIMGVRGLMSKLAAAKVQYTKVTESLPTLENGAVGAGSTESPLRTTQISKLKAQLDCNDEVLQRSRAKLDRLNRLCQVPDSA